MNRLFLIALLCGCNYRPLGPVQGNSEPLCQFEGGERAVLAALEDHTVRLIHADRSQTAVLSFDHPEARTFFSQVLVARGDFIAASAGWVAHNDQQGWSVDLALLDREGKLRWQGAGDNASPQLYLNAKGWLAIAMNTNGILVDPEGRERTLTNLTPIAEPLEDGSVAVRNAPQGEQPGTLGWVRDGAVEPLGMEPAEPWATPVMVGGRLAYVAKSGVLVSERPGDVRTVPLPGVDVSTVSIIDRSDSGWVLVGDWRTPSYLVNLRTLEARPVGVNTPEGFRPFMGAINGPRLDSDGALLVGLRDDYAGALYRSTDGRTWDRVGGTVTNVLDIDALARGGTYLINATNGRYSIEEWTPAPAGRTPDYDGDSLQVVRPQSGVSQRLKLATAWVEISNLQLTGDGRCLAWWDAPAEGTPSLNAYDVDGGRSFSLLQSSAPTAFAWLE